MTGGFEDGYGSGGSSPVPTEGPDDERGLSPDVEASAELSDDVSGGNEEIPRNTRPFRAWGAAQERQPPSLWERFTSWMRGIFSRTEDDEPKYASEAGIVVEDSADVERAPVARSSYDDLDAPWTDGPFPVEERRSSRPSAERPSVEDFQERWDGTYGTDPDPITGERLAAAKPAPVPEPEPEPEADPLWDTPVVAEAPAPAPMAFDSAELDQVWSAPSESATAPEAGEEEPQQEKKGFFARLFGRKKKDPDALSDDQRVAASEWASEIEAAEAGLAPADADFVEDVAASTAPAETDFVDDVAAALPPAEADFDEPEVVEARVEVVDVVEIVDAVPSIEEFEAVEPADEVIELVVDVPPVEAPKRPSFIGRLFGRKQAEPEPELPAVELDADVLLPPADADFAADVTASTAPAETDFIDDIEVEAVEEVIEPVAEEPLVEAPKRPSFIGRLFSRKKAEPPAPSIDHSAEDAANLAALLGPITTPETDFESEPTELIAVAPVVDEVLPDIDAPVEAEPEIVAAVEAEVEIVAEVEAEEQIPRAVYPEEQRDERAQDDIAQDDIEEEQIPRAVYPEEQRDERAQDDIPVVEPLPDVVPLLEPDKRPGFFSSLLKRVSRSQFMPRLSRQRPVVEEVPEIAEAEAPAEDKQIPRFAQDDIPAEDEQIPRFAQDDIPAEDAAAKWARPETPAHDPLFDDVAPVEATIPEPVAPPSVPSEFEATQPFPAFRDARDDFSETIETAPVVDGGRPTEQVEIPAFDEGQKTDEFEVVPPAGLDGKTAETQPISFWARLLGRKPAPVSGEAAATPPVDDKTPFVLAKFRTFYNEVIRDKHQKSDVISGFATAVLSAPAADMSDPEFAAQLLSKRLGEMLELQAAESNWTGGDAAKYYPEAQYAMVALADETFATFDWPGRSSWHKYMLEPKMYGTRGAELEFFKRIDKLLKEAPQDKGARDLARLYLLVIASGFRGKFRVPNVKRPLAEYRRRLFEFSHQADPLELYARDRHIFPDAVEHTLASRAVGRFTPAQKWIAAVLILLVLYLGVSHYAWTRLSAELKDVMSRIENTDATTGKTP